MLEQLHGVLVSQVLELVASAKAQTGKQRDESVDIELDCRLLSGHQGRISSAYGLGAGLSYARPWTFGTIRRVPGNE